MFTFFYLAGLSAWLQIARGGVGYGAGVLKAKFPAFFIVLFFAIPALVISFDLHNHFGERLKPIDQPKATPIPQKPMPDPRAEACSSGMDARLMRAKEASAKKDYSAAYSLLDYCSGLIVDKSEAFKARELYWAATVEAETIFVEKEKKALKARKKKEGVAIGMSRQDAIDSSWGKPRKINRTTTAHGTREQWVYDGGYLYFTDDELTSIQN